MSILVAPAFTLSLIAVVLVLSLGLAVVMGNKARKSKSPSLLFWFSAMVIFTASIFLELLFSVGEYDQFSLKMYVFLVALLVELLALGSVFLTSSKILHILYVAYSLATSSGLAISLYVFPLGRMIVSHVFYGPLPLSDTIMSSAATFPAAAIIVVKAAMDLRKGFNPNLASIIAGVVVVSVAGTLYIAGFPSFLYLAEFVGIFLLWLGFVRIPIGLRNSTSAS